MMECVFCHKEKLVTDIVYEDEMVMAFMDMEPRYEGDGFGWTYGEDSLTFSPKTPTPFQRSPLLPHK